MTIDCRQVTKVYGRGRRQVAALMDVTFQVEPGEILGVVGPNGAGKTTLLRVIAGDVPLSSGSVRVEHHRAGTQAARRAIGYATDPPAAPAELTGSEWLRYLASQRSKHPAARERLLRWAVGVGDVQSFADRRVAGYSRGMAQRLALAAAAITAERVVLLDETLSGVDPLAQRRLRLELAQLAAAGRAVLLASHDLGAVERLATRVLILSTGRVRADVTMAALLSERVAEIAFTGAALSAVNRVMRRFSRSTRTGQGIAVPLRDGLTVETVLAACREERLAVAGSRVRYRALEDILVQTLQPEDLT